MLAALYTGAFFLFLFLVGPWDWVSYYLRYVWVTLLIVVLLLSFRRVRAKPLNVRGGGRTWSDLITLLVFLGLIASSVRGYGYAGEPLRLAFPLRDGRYYVGQGGSSLLLNYHVSYEPQRYAVDIVALNALGARAAGFYPREMTRYEIFGATVHSPCDGWVTRVVDGLPDQQPSQRDASNPAGNHVVVHCQGANVVLAHLQRGSVAVREGEPVSEGQPLGKVGNSGNTSEPHLHIHAVRADDAASLDGEPVPLLFGGRFPVRNMVLRR